MKRFTQWGNELYTGETSIGFIRRRNTWFVVAILLICLSVAAPFIRGGFNFGIEFTGGSEFQVSQPATTDQALATEDVAAYSETPARVQQLGDGSIRVQTDSLTQEQNNQLRADLAASYDTSARTSPFRRSAPRGVPTSRAKWSSASSSSSCSRRRSCRSTSVPGRWRSPRSSRCSTTSS